MKRKVDWDGIDDSVFTWEQKSQRFVGGDDLSAMAWEE